MKKILVYLLLLVLSINLVLAIDYNKKVPLNIVPGTEFTIKHEFTNVETTLKTSDIAVAVEASYSAVSANASVSSDQSKTLSNSKTTTKLTVTGGNSQYANNISNPETYRLWADGIETMPVLCDFDQNSLKPIWDFCTDATRKAQLKAEFNKLLKAHPLPAAMAASMMVSNQVYFVRNAADNMYINILGREKR